MTILLGKCFEDKCDIFLALRKKMRMAIKKRFGNGKLSEQEADKLISAFCRANAGLPASSNGEFNELMMRFEGFLDGITLMLKIDDDIRKKLMTLLPK